MKELNVSILKGIGELCRIKQEIYANVFVQTNIITQLYAVLQDAYT